MCMKVESPITATIFLSLSASAAALVEAERHAHRGAHRDAGIERVPRVAEAERVAADVAGDGDVAQLRQRVIDAEVRAGHAHRRRPREDRQRRSGACRFLRRLDDFPPSRRPMAGLRTCGASSPCRGRISFADDLDACALTSVSSSGSTSSTTTHCSTRRREGTDLLEQGRIGKAELEYRRLRIGFPRTMCM